MSQSDMDKSYFVAFCIEQYKALNEMDGAAVASGRRRIVSDVDRPQLTNHMLELVSATIFLGITSTLTISYRGDLVAVPHKGVEAVMTGCVHRLSEGYRKRSSEIFTRMLVESAEVMRMMEG